MIEETLIDKFKIGKLKFSYPNQTRFSDLFLILKPKGSSKKKKCMSVNPQKIMLNKDLRTSIIIKNIPNGMSGNALYSLLLSINKNIDFFYIPKNIKTRKHLRVAFLNLLSAKDIVTIYMFLLYKFKFQYEEPNVNLEICYSRVQGKESLYKRFFADMCSNAF